MTGVATTDRRGFFSGYFLVVAGILLVGAIGLRPAIDGLIRYYSKEPIELRKKLDLLDIGKISSWRVATQRLQYQLAEGDVETEDTINVVLEPDIPEPTPLEQAMLFVTYYSDPRNRISHTPEVCYRQSGAVIHSLSTIEVETPGLGPEFPKVEARLLDIRRAGRRTLLLYVFVCNGQFYHDRERVRVKIGWPGDKRIYFSKVEVISICPRDEDYDAALAQCKSLLREALPVLVNEHYPANADLR